MSSAGCNKSDTKPEASSVTTTVEGYVRRKFTNTPAAGVTMTLRGYKPYESSGFCLFCPDSTSFDIASVCTDSNGYYFLEGTTTENVTSTIIWSGAGAYGRYIPKGVKSSGIDFVGVKYIVLKEHFHVINNNRPPLIIHIPISCCIPKIYGNDTDFVAYGASLDTGVTEYNGYRIMDQGVEISRSEQFRIGGYQDTIEYYFTIDPSTF